MLYMYLRNTYKNYMYINNIKSDTKMTEHNLEHLKTFAGKIIMLTHEKNPGDNFLVPVKRLRAMAEYILDSPYPHLESPDTELQKNVLCIIEEFVTEGIQPTLKNIGTALDNPCKKVVTATVNELIELGCIAREGEKKRIVLKTV